MLPLNPNTKNLLGQIEDFKNSIQQIKTPGLLKDHYSALVTITKSAIQQLENQINLTIQKNWRNYLESWIALFINIPFSDPGLIVLKSSLDHYKNLLDDLLKGSISRLYNQSLERMQYTLYLAQTDRNAFITHILDININELNDQEITMFAYYATALLRSDPHEYQKEFIRLRCSIYLWLSNLASANSECIVAKQKEVAGLPWWLSTIGKCYLFTAYHLGSCAYDSEELSALNHLVYNWLSAHNQLLGNKKQVGSSFTKLIQVKNQYEFESSERNRTTYAPRTRFFSGPSITLESPKPQSGPHL